MFYLMILIFVLGYTAIAMEHTIKIDKAASALFIGVTLWTVYMLNNTTILNLGLSPSWTATQGSVDITHFIIEELEHHIIEIAQILFFLLGAMTIVEVVDQHEGFKIITDKITAKKKVKLMWIIGIITFFMSAALDNLTTTIVMIALLRKLIDDKKTRWMFASIIVIAANAGGAWSPIGDVTTIMLWIGGQVTAGAIIKSLLLPSIINIVVPLTILSFILKGTIEKPKKEHDEKEYTSARHRKIIFAIGVGSLLFVPIFKTYTHLPPFMGMLLGLSILWISTEIMLAKKAPEYRKKLNVYNVLKRIDTPTIFFFMGILAAVAALQSAGHLAQLGGWLDDVTNKNVYVINIVIGILSSIVDNVPLVAGSMGMYSIQSAGVFAVDGTFWEFLAYCAGTGGSILIIGSAAGVAAMGLEKIDFMWYLKKISLLALIGYLAGAGTYILFN